MFCNITNAFAVAFDQLNGSLLYKKIRISLKKNLTDPKPLNGMIMLNICNFKITFVNVKVILL